METIAGFIKNNMTQNKISIRQFEKKSGINRGLLSRYINGICVPNLKNSYRIAEAIAADTDRSADLIVLEMIKLNTVKT
mgnify:FL=1